MIDRRTFVKSLVGIFTGGFTGSLWAFLPRAGSIQTCDQNESKQNMPLVMGIGHAGLRILENLLGSGQATCQFIAMDTNAEDLASCAIQNCIQLQEPEGNCDHDLNLDFQISKANKIIIVGGLGGATCSKYSSQVASRCTELGKEVIGIFYWPFRFEGRIKHLRAFDSVMRILNLPTQVIVLRLEGLMPLAGKDMSLGQALSLSDNIAVQTLNDVVRGNDLIYKHSILLHEPKGERDLSIPPFLWKEHVTPVFPDRIFRD